LSAWEVLDRREFLCLAGSALWAATAPSALGAEPLQAGGGIIRTFPPFFGERREPAFPPLERIAIRAGDGTQLWLHHTSGGERGPVVVAPGTAMTALSYGLDTVPRSFIEFLVSEGFDVWLFDWRTSPLLTSHAEPYRMEDVARYDWPAAIGEVRRRTGKRAVTVLAHCLSSPCLLLSLVRGHVPAGQVRGMVASQVALDLVMTQVGMLKVETHVDRAIPAHQLVHQKPEEVEHTAADLAVSVLARIVPKSYSCDNPACYRHSATFGDLIFHDRVDERTHTLMGDLVPVVVTGFLHDVGVHARRRTVLEHADLAHLDRLAFPIQLVSGRENRMFVPESTARSYERLVEANGPERYERIVHEGFGHLDYYIGRGADEEIWPGYLKVLG
jgi:alpha-beta hydrolase superfamily lysophospholipase